MIKKDFPRKNNNAGFTLVELLVAMGIFVFIIGSAGWLMAKAFRYNSIVWEQLKTQNDGRRVLQEVVDIVRKAEESSIGSYPIAIAEEYELSIYSNIDSDSYREKVRFWLDGTTLKRGIIEPSGNPLEYLSENEQVVEIAHDVKNSEQGNPIFLYYDEGYTGTSTPMIQPVATSDVRIITVQLELEEDPTETPIPFHVESTVNIRNLKTN